MKKLLHAINGTYRFYREGFRGMTVGRTLWTIILIKLAIMFLVLKLFFFPDVLADKYPDTGDRADAVRNHLVNP